MTACFPPFGSMVREKEVLAVNEDWLLDQVANRVGEDSSLGDFPSLASLGIGYGSNRIRDAMGPVAADIEAETVVEAIRLFCLLESIEGVQLQARSHKDLRRFR